MSGVLAAAGVPAALRRCEQGPMSAPLPVYVHTCAAQEASGARREVLRLQYAGRVAGGLEGRGGRCHGRPLQWELVRATRGLPIDVMLRCNPLLPS